LLETHGLAGDVLVTGGDPRIAQYCAHDLSHNRPFYGRSTRLSFRGTESVHKLRPFISCCPQLFPTLVGRNTRCVQYATVHFRRNGPSARPTPATQ
jgi:hypothetical protein